MGAARSLSGRSVGMPAVVVVVLRVVHLQELIHDLGEATCGSCSLERRVALILI